MDSHIFFSFNLLQYDILLKIHEEYLTSHKYVVVKVMNILIAFQIITDILTKTQQVSISLTLVVMWNPKLYINKLSVPMPMIDLIL